MLGAQGVNIGTRFLAATECGVPQEWKTWILAAASQDAVKLTFAEHILPTSTEGGYDTVARSLRTPFVDEWNERPAEAATAARALRERMMAAMSAGTAYELIPMAGQTVGLINDIAPAADILHRLVAEAERALRDAYRLAGAS